MDLRKSSRYQPRSRTIQTRRPDNLAPICAFGENPEWKKPLGAYQGEGGFYVGERDREAVFSSAQLQWSEIDLELVPARLHRKHIFFEVLHGNVHYRRHRFCLLYTSD